MTEALLRKAIITINTNTNLNTLEISIQFIKYLKLRNFQPRPISLPVRLICIVKKTESK